MNRSARRNGIRILLAAIAIAAGAHGICAQPAAERCAGKEPLPAAARAAAGPETPQAAQTVWQPLPKIQPKEPGYELGVSAMYAGSVGGVLLTAGGANFPEVPAAEGGRKAFYKTIYLLRSGKWRSAGTLPEASAYGMSFVVDGELVCAGGSGASGTLDRVVRLRPHKNRVAVEELPSLPCPVEQGAGAAIGSKLFIAGGITDGKPSAACWMLDTRADQPQWKRLAPLPEPLVQPVMAASNGMLYLWGGFDSAAKTVSGNGYRYDPATDRWESIAGVPDGGTFTGACAATLADGRILCTGGVDRAIFTDALSLPAEKSRAYLSQPVEAYRFRRTLWIFDPETGVWSDAGETQRTARAGAMIVPHAGGICLLGGELKPGIRTPDNSHTTNLK